MGSTVQRIHEACRLVDDRLLHQLGTFPPVQRVARLVEDEVFERVQPERLRSERLPALANDLGV